MIQKLHKEICRFCDQGGTFHMGRVPNSIFGFLDFDQQKEFSLEVFESKSKDSSYLLSRTSKLILLCLIRLRSRKVVWTRTLNLLDIVPIRRIQELARTRGWTSQRFDMINQYRLKNVLIDQSSNSLICNISKGRVKLLIKVPDFRQSRAELKESQIMKIYNLSSYTLDLITRFSDEHLIFFEEK